MYRDIGDAWVYLALLAEAGLLTEQTVIVTTLHELQVLDEELPEDEHDFRVDLIVTPQRVIDCGPAKRPGGLSWDSLSPDKIAAIPAQIAAYANSRATVVRQRIAALAPATRHPPVEVLFERVCRENGITQRLTRPRSPTTTGKAAIPPAESLLIGEPRPGS